MALASKLSGWLADAGMTQGELARHLQVPSRRVRAWCRETQIAPITYAKRLEVALGLAPDEAVRVLYADAARGVGNRDRDLPK